MKLRGSLLGAGNIALRGHAPQWCGDEMLRDEVEIVALADLSASNLAAAAAVFPAAHCYTSAEDLLEREEIDFCDICTPPSTHRRLIESAALRGRHLLCEKPLAPTSEDGAAISRAVRTSGIVFQPCHQHRYSPQWLALHATLPELGRVFLAEYEVNRCEANPGNANWNPAWRTDAHLAGGGILVDHGGHVLYQLRAIMGDPTSVQAVTRTLRHHGYGVEDSAYLLLDFKECLANVRLTWAAARRSIRYRFIGERGELEGDDNSLRILTGEGERKLVFQGGLSADSAHSEWFSPLFREFVGRVRAGNRTPDGLDEALYVTELVACAYRSSQERRAIDLPVERSATADVLRHAEDHGPA